MNMEKLTLQEAINRVLEIEEIKDDDESAHSSEDKLLWHFMSCLKSGMYSDIEEIKQIAIEISKSGNIDFSRWCA